MAATSELLTPMDDWQDQVLDRVDEFCSLAQEAKEKALRRDLDPKPWATLTTWSAIGTEIANDPGLFFRIRDGQSITLTTYERIREWFDKNWPRR